MKNKSLTKIRYLTISIVCLGLLYIMASGCTGQLTLSDPEAIKDAITDQAPVTTLAGNELTDTAMVAPTKEEQEQVDPKITDTLRCPTSERVLDEDLREMRGVNCDSFMGIDIQTLYQNSLNTPGLLEALSERLAQRIVPAREYESLKDDIISVVRDFIANSSNLSICREAPSDSTALAREEQPALSTETSLITEEPILQKEVVSQDIVRSYTRVDVKAIPTLTSGTISFMDAKPILYVIKAKSNFTDIFNKPEYVDMKAKAIIESRFDGTYQDLGSNYAIIASGDRIIFGYAPLVALQTNERAPLIDFPADTWSKVIPKSNFLRRMNISVPASTETSSTALVESTKTSEESTETVKTTAERVIETTGLSILKDDICEENRTVLNENEGSFEQEVSARKFTPEEVENILTEMSLPDLIVQPVEETAASSSYDDVLAAIKRAASEEDCLRILDSYVASLTDDPILSIRKTCSALSSTDTVYKTLSRVEEITVSPYDTVLRYIQNSTDSEDCYSIIDRYSSDLTDSEIAEFNKLCSEMYP